MPFKEELLLLTIHSIDIQIVKGYYGINGRGKRARDLIFIVAITTSESLIFIPLIVNNGVLSKRYERLFKCICTIYYRVRKVSFQTSFSKYLKCLMHILIHVFQFPYVPYPYIFIYDNFIDRINF